jgi:hypothetical protein
MVYESLGGAEEREVTLIRISFTFSCASCMIKFTICLICLLESDDILARSGGDYAMQGPTRLDTALGLLERQVSSSKTMVAALTSRRGFGERISVHQFIPCPGPCLL